MCCELVERTKKREEEKDRKRKWMCKKKEGRKERDSRNINRWNNFDGQNNKVKIDGITLISKYK